MTEEKVQLVVGGLLHDIGKVIYRQGDDRRKHSVSGYDFLKDEAGVNEKSVLECVRYHHGAELRGAKISNDSFAYLTYISDNIAAAADRRKGESEDVGFEMTLPLSPVFNILNGNDAKFHYHAPLIKEDNAINEPTMDEERLDESFYSRVKENVWNNLQGIKWNDEYINSLLVILEANLTYVPSSTAKDELADISLYDHVKLTAAISSCIYDYLRDKGENDYKSILLEKAENFYDEKAFCLFSMDISGIQQFIYTIYSEGALKLLRARSFYLDLLMEHIIDVLLERLGLSRANLLYSGGGHCYILLANTKQTADEVDKFESELNEWLIGQFGTDLYVAVGMAQCSANDLKNKPDGSYSQLFRNVSRKLSGKKSHRYDAAHIMALNRAEVGEYTRECRVCKRLGKLNENDECSVCERISALSKNILYTDFFAVSKINRDDALSLPFGMYLYAGNDAWLRTFMESDGFVRAYSKNCSFSGKHIATRLWAGNYTTGETFEELAGQAEGIERIGILRADVDNLGSAIVSGFESEKNGNRYVTISRTATLSRQLSMFFKYNINGILERPRFTLDGKPKDRRKAVIVYSGGDDLFIAGAWDDIMELSIDIRDAFATYTEGTLTLSAGIEVCQAGYPIHVSASEAADLEDESKGLIGKNAVTFLPDGENHHEEDEPKNDKRVSDGTYHWQEFKESVIGEKYLAIEEFFGHSEDRGKNFLYNLLELIRHQDDKINMARYVYLLARMEPAGTASPEEKARYRKFSMHMYDWIRNPRDCRELKTAINLYAYRIREKEEK